MVFFHRVATARKTNNHINEIFSPSRVWVSNCEVLRRSSETILKLYLQLKGSNSQIWPNPPQ